MCDFSIKAKYSSFLTILVFSINLIYAQSDSANFKSSIRDLNSRGPLILVDHNGTHFILDFTRTCITAINKKGKKLWSTNPIIDNNLQNKFLPHPYIRDFELGKGKWTSYKEQIIITYYYNMQGFLDKKTGKFTFIGQD